MSLILAWVTIDKMFIAIVLNHGALRKYFQILMTKF